MNNMFIQVSCKSESNLINLDDICRVRKYDGHEFSNRGIDSFYVLIYFRHITNLELCFDTDEERNAVFEFIVEQIDNYNKLKYPNNFKTLI